MALQTSKTNVLLLTCQSTRVKPKTDECQRHAKTRSHYTHKCNARMAELKRMFRLKILPAFYQAKIGSKIHERTNAKAMKGCKSSVRSDYCDMEIKIRIYCQGKLIFPPHLGIASSVGRDKDYVKISAGFPHLELDLILTKPKDNLF